MSFLAASRSLCSKGFPHRLSLTFVVKYDNLNTGSWMAIRQSRKTRPISWLKAALKEFQDFLEGARSICLTALTVAAEGAKADIAKSLHNMGSGVFEIALAFKGDAFRVVYAVQLGDEIWVVHAFQKKSTQGIKTPKHETDLIKDRLKRL